MKQTDTLSATETEAVFYHTGAKADRDTNHSGRRAFGTGTCELHGPAEDGSPCAKFSHLPGSGSGPAKRRPFLIVKLLIVSAGKPIVVFSLMGGGYYLFTHGELTGSLLRRISPLHSATSGMPTVSGPSSTPHVHGSGTGTSGISPSSTSRPEHLTQRKVSK